MMFGGCREFLAKNFCPRILRCSGSEKIVAGFIRLVGARNGKKRSGNKQGEEPFARFAADSSIGADADAVPCTRDAGPWPQRLRSKHPTLAAAILGRDENSFMPRSRTIRAPASPSSDRPLVDGARTRGGRDEGQGRPIAVLPERRCRARVGSATERRKPAIRFGLVAVGRERGDAARNRYGAVPLRSRRRRRAHQGQP